MCKRRWYECDSGVGCNSWGGMEVQSDHGSEFDTTWADDVRFVMTCSSSGAKRSSLAGNRLWTTRLQAVRGLRPWQLPTFAKVLKHRAPALRANGVGRFPSPGEEELKGHVEDCDARGDKGAGVFTDLTVSRIRDQCW